MLVGQMFSGWLGLVVATEQYILNPLKYIENLGRMKNLETRDQAQNLSLKMQVVRKKWKTVLYFL